jgi:hypothetical protein
MFGSPASRFNLGRHAYGVIYADQYGNIVGGNNAGPSSSGTMDYIGGGDQQPSGHNIVLGDGAGGNLAANDRRNVLIGRQAGGRLKNAQTFGYGHNVIIGDLAGSAAFSPGTFNSYSGSVAIGRAAGFSWTSDSYDVAIGHAAMFLSNTCIGCIAIGDTAAGAAIDGTATNFQGTGLTYWGAVGDLNCSYLGRYSGKSSAAARTNAHAIGALARIPIRDNVIVLGHTLGAVETSGRYWDGWARTDITSTTGLTVTAAQLSGLTVRAGVLAGAVNDTTDTAANIVINGPGQNCEVPCSTEFSYSNSTSGGFTVTLVGGTGVSVSGLGLGGAVASGILAKFRIQITNSTAGAEAVSLYRVG